MQATFGTAREWLLRRPWAMGALVAVAAFAALVISRIDPPIHVDTARDLVQSAACATGNDEMCQRGVAASLRTFVHGTLWIRFLAICQTLGLVPNGIQVVTLAFVAAGAGVTAIVARTYAGKRALVPAGSAFVLLSLKVVEYPDLWSPALLPLPLALFVWALLEHSRLGRASTAVGAAIFLALAIDVHLVCAALVPLLLAATGASARRPKLTAPIAIATLGGTLMLASPASWKHNWATVRVADLVLLGVVFSIAWILACFARSHWLRLDASRRAAVLVLALIAWSVFPPFIDPRWRYFAPSLPALAIGLGWAFRGVPFRVRLRPQWMLAAATVLLVTAAQVIRWASVRIFPDRWTVTDVLRLAPAIQRNGFEGRQSLFQIEGIPSFGMEIVLASTQEPAVSREENLLVVRAPRSSLHLPIPSDWTLVDLGHERVAVVRPLRPFLHRKDSRLCAAPTVGGAGEMDCQKLTLETVGFSPVPPASKEGVRVEWWLDVETDGEDSAHALDLIDECGDWTIERVEGVSYEGALPGNHVVLHGNSGSGKLLVVRHLQAGKYVRPYWPPLLMETLPDEVELRRFIELIRRGATRWRGLRGECR